MSSRWERAERLLAIRLDSLGDVLMTGPALRALASRGAHVTLLTSPAGAAVAGLLPEVEEVIVYEAPWMKASAPRSEPALERAMVSRLRRGSFDGAAIFTVYSQSPLPAALLCHLAGIPLRAAHCRENPYQLLTDWIREPEPLRVERHEVERQLALTAELGFENGDSALRVAPPAAAAERVERLLDEIELDCRQPWLVLHPGATAPARRYPVDRYASAARSLVDEHGWRVVVVGGEDDANLAERLVTRLGGRAVSLAGRLNLGELAALIARAPLFIGNNSGPAHLAAAVATPAVVLYALTNPQHTPWGVPSRVLSHDVPCRNCYSSVCPAGHHLCLLAIEPAEIVAAALSLHAETATTLALTV
ncbi:MAG TPA: lipopolysaccharide heptosyltransferase II [Candidatus Limnocylindria bacterium]|nr:lipopolysaccharide heptosyltransferase II [Candidatus Limnocylindria bacterium]